MDFSLSDEQRAISRTAAAIQKAGGTGYGSPP